jgi:hypothetical protein
MKNLNYDELPESTKLLIVLLLIIIGLCIGETIG